MRITANMVTITRIVLMPIPGYLLYGGTKELFVALAAIIILGLTDWLDGIMARKEGPSVLGGLLDPIADKIFIAVIYLPLADLGIIPIALAACIFSRDFVVTTLRTSLSLRDAPMRTSTLAKYKTAIQMTGIGYIILYLSFAHNPDAVAFWVAMAIPLFIPVGVIGYRLVKGIKQGPRSATMLCLMVMCIIMRFYLGTDLTIQVSVYIITALTVISGFSYLVDAWSALKGQSGSFKESLRLILDGVLVPVSIVCLLAFYNSALMSVAIILMITLELAVGGLGNLLASQKQTINITLTTTKSLVQTALASAALGLSLTIGGAPHPTGEMLILAALSVTTILFFVVFWRHRRDYLSVI